MSSFYNSPNEHGLFNHTTPFSTKALDNVFVQCEKPCLRMLFVEAKRAEWDSVRSWYTLKGIIVSSTPSESEETKTKRGCVLENQLDQSEFSCTSCEKFRRPSPFSLGCRPRPWTRSRTPRPPALIFAHVTCRSGYTTEAYPCICQKQIPSAFANFPPQKARKSQRMQASKSKYTGKYIIIHDKNAGPVHMACVVRCVSTRVK